MKAAYYELKNAPWEGKSWTNSWRSRGEGWTEDLSTTDIWRSSCVPFLLIFPLRLKLSHNVELEGHCTHLQSSIQRRCLLSGDTFGTRLWACSKKVIKGSPITSITAGEKWERKLEISMKTEVNQLRGLALGRGEGGKQFQWQLQ